MEKINNINDFLQLFLENKLTEDFLSNENFKKDIFTFNLKYEPNYKEGEAIVLNSSAMEIMINLQNLFYDIISISKYDGIGLLSNKEKEEFKINFIIQKGCTNCLVNFNNFLNTLVEKKGINKTLIIVFTAFILYRGCDIIINHQNSQKEITIETIKAEAKKEEAIMVACINKSNQDYGSKYCDTLIKGSNYNKDVVLPNLEKMDKAKYQNVEYTEDVLKETKRYYNNINIKKHFTKEKKSQQTHNSSIVDIDVTTAINNKPKKNDKNWKGIVNVNGFSSQISFKMLDIDFQNNIYKETEKVIKIKCLLKSIKEKNTIKYQVISVYEFNGEKIKNIPENIENNNYIFNKKPIDDLFSINNIDLK